jgi:hypothetical protein
MSRIPYSARELAFIEARKALTRVAIHAAFVRQFHRTDVTVEHIKALCSRKGWATRQPWSADEDTTLRALYPDTPTEQVAQRMRRSLSSTYQRAKTLGLRKSAAYLASPASGRTNGRQGIGTRFAKGHVPVNKGKAMPFHPNSAATRFKAGQRPHNTKYLGHERISKDGYVEISVNERNKHTGFERRHVLKHRWLWEQQYGPVPDGFALKSLDGNKQNTDPSNWVLIPRAILPRLNGGRHGRTTYDNAPAELKPTILAVAKLAHAAKSRRAS